jgi:flagellin
MPQTIQTNFSALNTQRSLAVSSTRVQAAFERLSSGLRINTARDDAAGLAISERMTGQIRGLNQARRNANDGLSMTQTAEGALGQMGYVLQRIRELAVQSANATNTASDRQALNEEVNQLVAELDRFAQQTEFNGMKLLDGANAAPAFQVGANALQTIATTTANFRTAAYGSHQVGNARFDAFFVATDSVGIPVSGAAVEVSGDLVLRGPAGSARVSVDEQDSALSIANKINAQKLTGITAQAYTETTLSFDHLTGSGAYTLAVSNDLLGAAGAVPISFHIGPEQDGQGLSDVIEAFNAQSSKTGISARLAPETNALVLTASDGSNIHLERLAAPATDVVILANGNLALGNSTASATIVAPPFSTLFVTIANASTIAGNVLLDADKAFSISLEGAGASLRAATFGSPMAEGQTLGSALESVQNLDLGTALGAAQAIRIADQALAAVNRQRADLGAVQKRFEHAIGQLMTSAENLSAARSRIRDTDFAQETAELTRGQILQQAGTAMLAQANSLPNNVLSLLRS